MDKIKGVVEPRDMHSRLRVFISEPIHVGWIIEKLMRDLAAELNRRGIETRIGEPDAYAGQEIVFHSRYLYATAVSTARINSLFITHIDDKLKEMELRGRIGSFNSFVCTSHAEADLVCGLGCPSGKVAGIALPHRGEFVRRPKVALFSERYDDGRKNEDWLLEYFAENGAEVRNSFIVCLIGYNWEGFCARMAELGLSFELYRYDRKLPGEYASQKSLLERMDYLIYPGFDGGAMCIYDGIAAGLELIVSDNGYHRELSSTAQLFRTKHEFFAQLDRIANVTVMREKAMSEHTIGSYTDRLIAHWDSVLADGVDRSRATPLAESAMAKSHKAELQFYRSHYKRLSIRRIAATLYRQCGHLLRRFAQRKPTA